MSSFNFYRWYQFKVIPLACILRTRNHPLQIFCDIGRGTPDDADITQSQTASDGRLLSHVTLGRVESRKLTTSAQIAGRALRAEYCNMSIPQCSHVVLRVCGVISGIPELEKVAVVKMTFLCRFSLSRGDHIFPFLFLSSVLSPHSAIFSKILNLKRFALV